MITIEVQIKQVSILLGPETLPKKSSRFLELHPVLTSTQTHKIKKEHQTEIDFRAPSQNHDNFALVQLCDMD